MTVPTFAKEAAEKAVSDFRAELAHPATYPSQFEMTLCMRPEELLQYRGRVDALMRDRIRDSVRRVIFDMIMGGGGIPSMPELSIREGEEESPYAGTILLEVKARNTSQDDTSRRELTKALATILREFNPRYPAANEALTVLRKHGHTAEIPDHMKARPYG